MLTSTAPQTPALNADQLNSFVRELKTLGQETYGKLGAEDFQHLKKIERWGRLATCIGVLTAWFPNPLSVFCLSLGRSTRWLLMHHISHGGYNRIPNIPQRYTNKGFALGKRRFLDWFDWMVPEAWMYEHNVLHHCFSGQDKDPDLIERNVTQLQQANLPLSLRYTLLFLLAATWRASYYSPNTLTAWLQHRQAQAQQPSLSSFQLTWELVKRCYLPYSAFHFVLFPLLFLPFGLFALVSALINSLLADILTNFHTFLVVGPNHTGEDLYRFDHKPNSLPEYYLHQIAGSVNYHCGNNRIDFAHLWLNYQIEHHIWPDLPMLKYRQVQPQVKALCEKYAIPYLQESIWVRFKKMVDVFVGKSTMRRYQAPLFLQPRPQPPAA